MCIVNIFAVHFFANHNKDYSVVKTFKAGLLSLAFFVASSPNTIAYFSYLIKNIILGIFSVCLFVP